jgi:hypothetical protein
VSGKSTPPRLVLSACESHQLAILIANMVEGHLRAAASTQHALSFEHKMRHNRQDQAAPLAEDGICLHSPVEHGTSTASS